MADIAPADVVAFILRLAFLAILYVTVGAMLLALRRSLSAAAAPPARRAARLTLIEASPLDGPPGRGVALAGDVTIGRRTACEVALRDDSVSGRHARLRRRRGQWEVEDLGSTNGTFVNGERVAGAVPLSPGDVIGVGTTTWRFEEAA
jgi:pSer/pThr/pTyr-binding forkhead associated (FHA) protein